MDNNSVVSAVKMAAPTSGTTFVSVATTFPGVNDMMNQSVRGARCVSRKAATKQKNYKLVVRRRDKKASKSHIAKQKHQPTQTNPYL